MAYLTDEEQAMLTGIPRPQQQAAPPGVNPLLAFQQQLAAAGLIPPARQMYQPTEADRRAMDRQRVEARLMNIGSALQGKGVQDVYALDQAYIDQRQQKLDQQWAEKAANAKMLSQMLPEDYVTFMAMKAENWPGSLEDFIKMQQARNGNIARSIQEQEYGMSLPPEERAAYFARIGKQPAASYYTMVPTSRGMARFDNRTGQIEYMEGVMPPQYDPFTMQNVREAEATGKGAGDINTQVATQVFDAPNLYASLDSQLANTRDLLGKLDKMPLGPVPAILLDKLGIGTDLQGEARIAAINNAVEFLSRAKLNPVSNAELGLALKTLIDLSAGVKPNEGQLNKVIKTLEGMQKRVIDQTRVNLNRMDEFDPQSAAYYRSPEADPFYQRVLNPEQQQQRPPLSTFMTGGTQ